MAGAFFSLIDLAKGWEVAGCPGGKFKFKFGGTAACRALAACTYPESFPTAPFPDHFQGSFNLGLIERQAKHVERQAAKDARVVWRGRLEGPLLRYCLVPMAAEFRFRHGATLARRLVWW